MVCSLSARSLSSQGFSIVVRRLIALLGCAGAVLAVTIAQAGTPAVEYKGATYIQAGKTWTCYAPHKKTGEIVPVKGMKVPLFSAWSGVMYDGAGWPIIMFNRSQLDLYPPIVELFAYHHECAHLTIPTTDEVLANCEGLIAMRRAGDITLALEEVLRDIHYLLPDLGLEYGGSGREFWGATVKCADLPLESHRR